MLRNFKLLARAGLLLKGHHENWRRNLVQRVSGRGDAGQCARTGRFRWFTMRRAPSWSLLEAATIPNVDFKTRPDRRVNAQTWNT